MLASSLFIASCQQGTCELAEQNKEVVRRYIEEVFNTGDVERLTEFVSPDYVEVYENQEYPIGLEGAEQHVLGVRSAFPDLQITIEQQIAEGDWVVSCITAKGIHQGTWLDMEPTGASLVFTAVNVDKVVDGKIVEHGGAANLFGPLLEAGSLEITKSKNGP
jgi:predicted ester cyclase